MIWGTFSTQAHRIFARDLLFFRGGVGLGGGNGPFSQGSCLQNGLPAIRIVYLTHVQKVLFWLVNSKDRPRPSRGTAESAPKASTCFVLDGLLRDLGKRALPWPPWRGFWGKLCFGGQLSQAPPSPSNRVLGGSVPILVLPKGPERKGFEGTKTCQRRG